MTRLQEAYAELRAYLIVHENEIASAAEDFGGLRNVFELSFNRAPEEAVTQ